MFIKTLFLILSFIFINLIKIISPCKIYNQNGGGIPSGSTSGNVSALFDDITGTLEYGVLATVNALEAVVYALELPSDFGTAFDMSDPAPNNVKTPKLS